MLRPYRGPRLSPHPQWHRAHRGARRGAHRGAHRCWACPGYPIFRVKLEDGKRLINGHRNNGFTHTSREGPGHDSVQLG